MAASSCKPRPKTPFTVRSIDTFVRGEFRPSLWDSAGRHHWRRRGAGKLRREVPLPERPHRACFVFCADVAGEHFDMERRGHNYHRWRGYRTAVALPPGIGFQIPRPILWDVERTCHGFACFTHRCEHFMSRLEEDAMSTMSAKPKLWHRYVDDVLAIVKRATIDSTLQHLNSQHPDIAFTMEVESNGRLPYLDATIRRNGNRVTTSVHRKPTDTGRYLSFDSHHHPSVQNAAPLALFCLEHSPSSPISPSRLQSWTSSRARCWRTDIRQRSSTTSLRVCAVRKESSNQFLAKRTTRIPQPLWYRSSTKPRKLSSAFFVRSASAS